MITSKDNPMVKEVRRLKDAKARKETGLFIAEGAHLVRELMHSTLMMKQVFLSAESSTIEEIELTQELKRLQIPVFELSEKVYRTLCETETPQGILCIAERSLLEELPKIDDHSKIQVLIIDRIQDPGNLGTLLRTAWSFGVDFCILTPGTADPYSGKVLRSSMGGTFHLPMAIVDPTTIIHWAEANHLTLYGGDAKAERVIDQINFQRPLGLIVGNEGSGLSREWYHSGPLQLVKIPMPGGAESLNVAVAASIMLYEVFRQSR